MKRTRLLALVAPPTVVALAALGFVSSPWAEGWSTAVSVALTSQCASNGGIDASAVVQGTDSDSGYGLAVPSTTGPAPTTGAETSFLVEAGPTGTVVTVPLSYLPSAAGQTAGFTVTIAAWYANPDLTGLIQTGPFIYSGSVTLASDCTSSTPPTTTTTTTTTTTIPITTTVPTTPTKVVEVAPGVSSVVASTPDGPQSTPLPPIAPGPVTAGNG